MFPDDIFFEILSKLPVKSLMRFKCVSKSLCSLIRDPHLAKIHRLHHLSRRADSLNIAMYHGNDRYEQRILQSYKLAVSGDDIAHWKQISFTMDQIQYESQIMSCEGLLCFVRDDRFHVCNPTTGVVERLPGTVISAGEGEFGFGYDPKRNEYKVVRLHEDKFEVFTLGSDGPWRSIEQTAKINCERPVTLNGVIYWISYSEPKIVAFDVGDEKLEEVKAPSVFKDSLPVEAMLVVLDGNLCLMTNERYETYTGSELDIWMLKDRTNGLWAKEYSIEPHLYGMPLKVRPLCMWRGMIVLQRRGYMIFFYDPKTRTVDEVFGDWGRVYCHSRITDYVESLVAMNRSDTASCLAQERKGTS